MAVPLHYNVRSLWVRKVTTGVTVAGVALVTVVLAGALMLAEGVVATMTSGGRPDVAIVVRSGSTAEMESNVDAEAVPLIAAAPGVAQRDGQPAVSAEVVLVLALDRVGEVGMSNVTLRGITEQSVGTRGEIRIVEGRMPQPGTDEAIVGARVAGRFKNLNLGDAVELRTNRPLNIVGVFDAEGGAAESEIWGDRDVIASAFGRTGGASVVRVLLTDPSAYEALRADVEADPRLGLKVHREPAFLEAQSEGLALFLRVMAVFISIFFSLGAIVGATITMHAAVAHRTREIGTLRALGFSRAAILGGFMAEAVVMTALGGGIGVAASLMLARFEVSMVNFATWSEIVFRFTPTLSTVGTAIVAAVGMGLVGGFIPSWRAARVSPLAALRS